MASTVIVEDMKITSHILRNTVLAFALVFIAFGSASCALDKLAVGMVSDALTSEGSNEVFTGDDDPQLVADALPFAIKLYESLLAMSPEHKGLIRTTGSLYVMYANAFVAGPADYLPQEQFDEKRAARERAFKLYIRGRDMIINGLDKNYPGFKTALEAGSPEEILKKMKSEDVGLLYWAAAGWISAFALHPVDVELATGVPRAAKLVARAYELNPGYDNGSLDDFYIQFYASLPEALGGDKAKAKTHYEKALERNKGRSAGTYLAYATSVYLPMQDREAFVELLRKALAIDPNENPATRLVTIINQTRAKWYLDNLDEFFI